MLYSYLANNADWIGPTDTLLLFRVYVAITMYYNSKSVVITYTHGCI